MEVVFQTCVNALVASSFFALTAVGLVLIFGVMGIVNFAHGEFFMAGAYAVWFFYSKLGWPFSMAVVAAIVIVTLIGLLKTVLWIDGWRNTTAWFGCFSRWDAPESFWVQFRFVASQDKTPRWIECTTQFST